MFWIGLGIFLAGYCIGDGCGSGLYAVAKAIDDWAERWTEAKEKS